MTSTLPAQERLERAVSNLWMTAGDGIEDRQQQVVKERYIP
jgi:hypothetical protein